MNIVETGQLLTIAGGFDRFITVDQITTTAWHTLLADTDMEAAQAAVLDFYRHWDGKGQLTVAHILDTVKQATRQSANQIAADVRAARARGLIDYDHHQSVPLPPDVAKALAEAREADRAAVAQHSYDHDPNHRMLWPEKTTAGVNLKTGVA